MDRFLFSLHAPQMSKIRAARRYFRSDFCDRLGAHFDRKIKRVSMA
jgi:hypothetical protein